MAISGNPERIEKANPIWLKSFAYKADAEASATMPGSEIDRGIFLNRSKAERTTQGDLLERYRQEAAPLRKSASDANRPMVTMGALDLAEIGRVQGGGFGKCLQRQHSAIAEGIVQATPGISELSF